MFPHHEDGVPTIRQLKIVEEVKKLVDEMKNLYKCNLTEQTVEKQTKRLKTSRKNLSLFIAFFPVRVATYWGSSSRLSYHASRSSVIPIIL